MGCAVRWPALCAHLAQRCCGAVCALSPLRLRPCVAQMWQAAGLHLATVYVRVKFTGPLASKTHPHCARNVGWPSGAGASAPGRRRARPAPAARAQCASRPTRRSRCGARRAALDALGPALSRGAPVSSGGRSSRRAGGPRARCLALPLWTVFRPAFGACESHQPLWSSRRRATLTWGSCARLPST